MKEDKDNKTLTIKKIFIKIFYIFIISVVVLELIFVGKTIIEPNKTPSIFGIKTFCIISGSMEPNIKINDVVIKEVPQEELKIGDIISFVVDGETITHRINNIEITQKGEIKYITKGDANNIEDEDKITFEDIEGKYIGKIPKIGRIMLLLRSKIVFIIILIILIGTIIIFRKNKDIK